MRALALVARDFGGWHALWDMTVTEFAASLDSVSLIRGWDLRDGMIAARAAGANQRDWKKLLKELER
jgi:hypothetical protein